jgi:hypothetical protein
VVVRVQLKRIVEEHIRRESRIVLKKS